MTLIPGRTDPRISLRPPISIKLNGLEAWANHGNCQYANDQSDFWPSVMFLLLKRCTFWCN